MKPSKNILQGLRTATWTLLRGYFSSIQVILTYPWEGQGNMTHTDPSTFTSTSNTSNTFTPMEENTYLPIQQHMTHFITNTAIGILSGTLLFTSTLATSVYHILSGIQGSIQGIYLSKQGMIWNEEEGQYRVYTLDSEEERVDRMLRHLFSLQQQQQPQPQKNGKRDTIHHNYLRRNRTHKYTVKDMTYYQLLKVPPNAPLSDIKKAYHREAILTHPDKHPNDPYSASKFQTITSIYQTLSHEPSRQAYDTYGICYWNHVSPSSSFSSSSPLSSPSITGQYPQYMDPYIFFSLIFGSKFVTPYIGDLALASMTDVFFQSHEHSHQHPNDSNPYLFTNQKNPNPFQIVPWSKIQSISSSIGYRTTFQPKEEDKDTKQQKKENDSSYLYYQYIHQHYNSSYPNKDKIHTYYYNLQQRKRQILIAKHVRNRIHHVVHGEISIRTFQDSCHTEATNIVQDGEFGDIFLALIGSALLDAAERYLGYETSFLGWKGQFVYLKNTAVSFMNHVATTWQIGKTIHVSIDAFLQARKERIETLSRMQSSQGDKDRHKNSSSFKYDTYKCFENEKNQALHSKVIQSTIQKLESSLPTILELGWKINAQDISYTIHEACYKLFIDSSVSLEERHSRAKAIQILGNEFLSVAQAEKKKLKSQNTLYAKLRRRVKDAFRESIITDEGSVLENEALYEF